MKKKIIEETAVADAAADEAVNEKEEKKSKVGFFGTIGAAGDLLNKFKDDYLPSVMEFYNHWIKPVYDNREQIKRRLNTISTAISLIFFIIYVPLLLFGKLADGLGLGWDIALYVCTGVYAVTMIALLIVTLVSGKSASTESAKRRKLLYRIVLIIVRVASVAVGITAIVISGNGKDGALDTIAMVVAIVSIIFSLLPLIFGSITGFFRWLISPAKIKRNFSFVALEWDQAFKDGAKALNKSLKRAVERYSGRIDFCLDTYLLPELGKKRIRAVDGDTLLDVLSTVPDEDRNITEWIVKQTFGYAEDCGYVEADPCRGLELKGDIELEAKLQKRSAAEEKKKARKGFLFKRKKQPEEPADEV